MSLSKHGVILKSKYTSSPGLRQAQADNSRGNGLRTHQDKFSQVKPTDFRTF
jgi:hypothetical protein